MALFSEMNTTVPARQDLSELALFCMFKDDQSNDVFAAVKLKVLGRLDRFKWPVATHCDQWCPVIIL